MSKPYSSINTDDENKAVARRQPEYVYKFVSGWDTKEKCGVSLVLSRHSCYSVKYSLNEKTKKLRGTAGVFVYPDIRAAYGVAFKSHGMLALLKCNYTGKLYRLPYGSRWLSHYETLDERRRLFNVSILNRILADVQQRQFVTIELFVVNEIEPVEVVRLFVSSDEYVTACQRGGR